MSKLNNFMGDTMDKIREMIDVNTVVGNPITTPDGTTLIPVSKVTFGFASGGTDADGPAQNTQVIRFGAGSGAGVSITPIAFIVVSGGNVRMIYVDPPFNGTVDKLIDMAPVVADKIKAFVAEKKASKE